MKSNNVIQLLLASIFLLLLLLAAAGAASKDMILIEQPSGTHTTFEEISRKFYYYDGLRNAQRRNYETIQAYEDRIKDGENKFSSYLRNTYTITNILPDAVTLDWENGILTLVTNFPFNIERKRESKRDGNLLKISIATNPAKGREILTFKEHIKMAVQCHINQKQFLVIDDLRVYYREEILLHEN